MDSNTSFIFRRPDLATRLVDDMMGRGPFHYGSGLFLAAPRRTGKSTFMRDDLRPALKDQGVLTTYVDLWEDKQRDPALLIGDAVKTTLRSLDGWGVKTLRKAGLAAELADDARALRSGTGKNMTASSRASAPCSGPCSAGWSSLAPVSCRSPPRHCRLTARNSAAS